jgi:dipeptidyl aminopeptidase/acylaminoacyl peptidase
MRTTPGYNRMVRYVLSSPVDQLQPSYAERFYQKPGDVVAFSEPAVFDIASKKEVKVDQALFPNAFRLGQIRWHDDSRGFTFDYNQRGHQVYRVIEVDASTGVARTLIDEQSKTFIDYSATSDALGSGGRLFRRDVNDGKEIIWLSERDGWSHLYLYDGLTGRVKNQITKGNWRVQNVQRVDTIARQIYFTATAMNPSQDPYFAHYYRINFDGTGLVTYTKDDGTHTVTFSWDNKYYTDTWTRVDLAPVTVLRRASDQSTVLELEKVDMTALLASGWKAPEVFVSKARDGATDIWGIVIKPSNFDPAKKYPVIEQIYAGPQGSFVPKSFAAGGATRVLAELGFIVVQIDGLGTTNRSRAFHDVAYKNLGDAGFPDRILWMKAYAAKNPWFDISRVGIYGTSAGGQNALGALLFHPEFYKVAFAAAGCHDNRMDKIWWNEQWMGWPLGPEYAASSNVDNAHKLQGKLLLVVGEYDTNVDPSSTMQVVNALIKANKEFDLLVIPGADHTNGGPYGVRKMTDFFVHNLLGVEPPVRNANAAPAGSPVNGRGNR